MRPRKQEAQEGKKEGKEIPWIIAKESPQENREQEVWSREIN